MTASTFSTMQLLAQNFIAQMVVYFLVVGASFLIVWRWGRQRFRRARIPAPSRVDAAQIRREILLTLLTFLVGTSSAGAILALHHLGHTSISATPQPLWTTLSWIVVCVLFNDLWFYAWHRLLHHPRFFRFVHIAHHKSVDVNPFTSYSFHAVEPFILGIWIVPVAVYLPIPMSAIGVLQVIGLANNLMSHLGYEFLPRWILRVPLLRLTNTATFHSLHHTRLKGNFGLHTRIWDKLFGTELPEYEQIFLLRGETPEETRDNQAEPSQA